MYLTHYQLYFRSYFLQILKLLIHNYEADQIKMLMSICQ